MSAIIKSANPAMVAVVRPVPLRGTGSAGSSEPSFDRTQELEERISALEARIAAMTQEAAVLRDENKTNAARSKAQGREIGLREAENREKERLAALERAINKACGEFGEALSAAERLGALLAKECLDKLFSDATGNAERVHNLLREQMIRLEQRELVEVVVSTTDFSEDALEDLRAAIPSRSVEIRRDPELPTGSCKLRPLLGEIDIGLDTQWEAVGELLTRIAMEGVPSC